MAIVYLLCGKVGCGKSSYAKKLKEEQNCFVLSCDDLMLTLFDECIGQEKHQDFLSRCKSFLYTQAAELIALQHDVVLDFGFWTKSERASAKELFEKQGIKTKLVYIEASDETIIKQLEKRNQQVLAGSQRAYHIDNEKRLRFNSSFEEPTAEEITLIRI